MTTFLEISRASMHEAQMVTLAPADLQEHQVRISVDRFGITANNITYGVFGVAMKYWDFFPASQSAAGRLPVWGFGTVIESRHPEVPVGQRMYGYWPLGTELVVLAGRLDGRSFVDVSAHRHDLPTPYNRYIYTEQDPAYHPDREDLHILLWPLFYTSFMIEDFLDDHANYGADTAVVSSASSKTSIGAAFLLKRRGATKVIGLTSPTHVPFAQSLGCYDEVYTYDEIESIALSTAVYVDVSGNRDVMQRVHHHWNEKLAYSMIVGDTHWDAESALSLPPVGPKPEFLFAPVQMAKRIKDWGRDEMERRVVETWHEFTAWSSAWLTPIDTDGPEALLAAYHDVLNGRVGPTVGIVGHFSA